MGMGDLSKHYRNLKLHIKFSIVITLLVIAVVASLIVVVSVLQRRAILEEVRKKAFGLTSVLAHSSVQAVLTDDYLLLQEIIDTIGSKEDVVYAMILDNEGKVIVHSNTRERGKLYPDERTRRAVEARGPLLQRFGGGEGALVWDLSRPVLTGTLERAGTARIGFSLKSAYAEVARTRERILLIGFIAAFLGVALSWLLAKTVSKPLRALVEAARRIGAGELSHRVEIEARDEIGQLASAFNQMGAELLKHREELHQKIDELSRLTAYNENILQSMHSGVVTVNYEGRIITFNRSAEQITGFDVAQAQGQPFGEFLSFCISLRGAVEEALQAGRVRTDAEASLTRADGREAVVRFSTRLLNHTNGRIRRGALVLFTDITQFKKIEEDMRRSERMAALGAAAAAIAHEIKTPLTSFQTFTALLPKKYDSPDFRERFLRTVLPQVDRLSVLVDDLLDFGRVRKPVLHRTDVNGVIADAAALLESAFQEKGVRLRQRFSPLPPIQADPEQLIQVFLNILRNALEATPEGGSVEIGTEITSPSTISEVPIEGEVSPPPLRITISDNGRGIPKEKLDKIFDPFFTTKSRGTGLGLAISYGIVRDHRGRIEMESREGEGTTFTIALPLGAVGGA